MACCSKGDPELGVRTRKEEENKKFERQTSQKINSSMDTSIRARLGGFRKGMSFKRSNKKQQQVFQLFGSCDILQPQGTYLLGLVLPYAVKDHNWVQNYSLLHHGASILNLFEKCAGLSPTLMIIQTNDEEIFGCYATDPWALQPNYYGGGDCWVFKLKPQAAAAAPRNKSGRRMSLGTSITSRFSRSGRNANAWDLSRQGGTRKDAAGATWSTNKYVWTGKNNFHQYSNSENIGIGGGGSFAFVIEDFLTTGIAGVSETYDNDMLYEKNDGKFEVKNIEVWSFSAQVTEANARKEQGNKRLRSNSDVNYGAGILGSN